MGLLEIALFVLQLDFFQTNVQHQILCTFIKIKFHKRGAYPEGFLIFCEFYWVPKNDE